MKLKKKKQKPTQGGKKTPPPHCDRHPWQIHIKQEATRSNEVHQTPHEPKGGSNVSATLISTYTCFDFAVGVRSAILFFPFAQQQHGGTVRHWCECNG